MFHVKHPGTGQESTNRETLAALAAEDLSMLGVAVDPERLRLCCDYLLEMLAVNRSVNLTAIREPHEALRLHLVDSLAVLPDVRSAPEGALCDIGSGGGFPGVPLCLATGRSGVLLDSVGRKTGAVRSILTGMRLSGVETVHARAEEHAAVRAEAYAVVTSRAVAELPVLLEYAAPLLQLGGTFLALKGSPSPDEIARGLRAARVCGLEVRYAREYVLPGGGESRQVVVFEKTDQPTRSLPRGIGRASKRPLA
jgi:16S rRNA (guanine527-N7)-methyltransferase